MTLQFDFARLEQLSIHYAYSGKDKIKKSQKPLLLCLHGFPEFWRTWQHLLNDLSDDFFVVAPDLRGYNLSDKPKGIENYHVMNLVQDVLDLVQHLAYEKFYLVGHDWGGIVAWTLATLHPELLHKLTIINSPHPRIFQKLLGTSPKQIAASSYINKFLDDSAEEKLTRDYYDLLWRFGFKDLVEKSIFTELDRDAHVVAWSNAEAITSMLASYRAARFQVPDAETELPIIFDVSKTLANHIDIPTQIIWGMDDTALTSECLLGLDEYIADYVVHEVQGAGHGVIHEKPALISKLLSDFFS